MEETTANQRRRVLLLSTYEMGRQPFGLASPAAWLAEAGAEVATQDLSIEDLDEGAVTRADVVGLYLPMHTATRLAAGLIPRLKRVKPDVRIVAYGLYAPLNADYLQALGVHEIIGGEFERPLLEAALRGTGASSENGQKRLRFKIPDRSSLPDLERYARLQMGDGSTKTVGYTEASRGCRHRCRHCPVVPVYEGRFHVVQPDVVLADIANQVAAGATHITFGDPDFFNGPAHAMRVVEAMNETYPDVTYDATIKVEHLAQRLDLIAALKETGCAFVTTAVESFDDRILAILDKGHTTEDLTRVLEETRRVGLALAPTFVAFTPWTTLEGYGQFLRAIRDLGLVDAVAPIQYAIRLLLPEGSLLLELDDIAALVEPFEPGSLVYPWSHPDERVDRLAEKVLAAVQEHESHDRALVFGQVWEIAADFGAVAGDPPAVRDDVRPLATIPYLTEPWYC